MADAQSVSKAAKKNQKRKGKKCKDGRDISAEEIHKLLKEQLEMAKMEGDHAKANKLRDQVWIMNDLCHGRSYIQIPWTDLPEAEYEKILESLPSLSNSASKSPSAQKDKDAEEEEESAKDSSLTEPEKQLKKLKKKLERIEKLKAKKDAGGSLEKNQLEKIESEQSVRDEIADLEELIEATLDLS